MKQTLRYSLLFVLASLGLAACAAGETEESESIGDTSIALSADKRYLVAFHDYSKRSQAIAAAGGKVALELDGVGAVAAVIPDQAVQGLANNPNVKYVEVDARRELYGQTVPYGIPMVQATDPAFTSASGSTKVCIIDSGYYSGHADLQGIPVTGYNGNLAWNVDGCAHGTHVAGTIAAVNNAQGVIGVAPNNVSLHIVRVFGDDCSWAYSSTLVDALNRCQQAGAKVINMSLGGTTKSSTEETAFNNAYNAGILSIAAAGNAGTTQTSFPAGYASVVSVGAIDANKALGSFSQRNADVELAAPGVGVLSTVTWSTPQLVVGSAAYNVATLEGGAAASASGTLVNGGLCDSVGAWSGRIVLCQRGGVSFADKTNNVRAGGGVAAIIYNNAPGTFSGTLGTGVSSPIPSVSMSQENGQFLIANSLGQSASINTIRTVPGSGYEAWDGTSMATPHVAAVAALIWSQKPTATNAEVRNALTSTAEDLGTAGRDSSFGFGLVRAKNALDALLAGGSSGGGGGTPTCKAAGASCSANSECCSSSCTGKGAKKTCK